MTKITAEELFPKTPEQLAKEKAEKAENEAYLSWYNPILDECLKLARKESALVKPRYILGQRVSAARKQLEGISNEKGWSGALGAFMLDLSSDLHLGQTTLYNCIAFADKFDTFEEFARQSFPIKRVTHRQKGSFQAGLKTPQKSSKEELKVPGRDLTWEEVCKYALPKNSREKKSESQPSESGQPGTFASSSREASKAEPWMSFAIQLPFATLQRFRQIAQQNGNSPEALLASYIQGYVDTYSK